MVVSMTLEELQKMAQQTAAFGVHPSGEFIYSFYTEQLQAFAALVASAEREACAKLLEEAAEAAKNADPQGFVWIAIKTSAEGIKERGQA